MKGWTRSRVIGWIAFACVAVAFLVGTGISFRRAASPISLASPAKPVKVIRQKEPDSTAKTPSAAGASTLPAPAPALSKAGANPKSGLEFWLEQSLAGSANDQKMDAERKRILAEVAQESIHDCVRNLVDKAAPKLFTNLDNLVGKGPVEEWREIMNDPRVARLFAIADAGTDTEKGELYEELQVLAQEAVRDKGFYRVEANAGAAVPVLIAHIQPSMETLETIREMWDPRMAAAEKARNDGVFICDLSELTSTLGLSADYVLDKLAEDDSLKSNAELQRKLQEYQEYKRATLDKVIAWVNSPDGDPILRLYEGRVLPPDWYTNPSICEYFSTIYSQAIFGISPFDYLDQLRGNAIAAMRTVLE